MELNYIFVLMSVSLLELKTAPTSFLYAICENLFCDNFLDYVVYIC